jgi:FkbM family methyltransferase
VRSYSKHRWIINHAAWPFAGTGTRLTHPADRTGFVSTLVEVWHDRVYSPPGFYRPANGDVVIDAGANVGLFTIWLARQNRIAAFWPWSRSRRTLNTYLRANLAAAQIAGATAHQLALGPVSGKSTMVSVGARSLDHRLHMEGNCEEGGQGIAVITLSDLFDLACVDRFALLKLDIEGAEYDVIGRLRREHMVSGQRHGWRSNA